MHHWLLARSCSRQFHVSHNAGGHCSHFALVCPHISRASPDWPPTDFASAWRRSRSFSPPAVAVSSTLNPPPNLCAFVHKTTPASPDTVPSTPSHAMGFSSVQARLRRASWPSSLTMFGNTRQLVSSCCERPD